MTVARLSALHIVDGFAWGWVLSDFEQTALSVHLAIDGRYQATEYVGLALPPKVMQVTGHPPSNAFGYAFALPVNALDGFNHSLQVSLSGPQGEKTLGKVLTYRSGPVCGEVRQQGRQFVGTVWFETRPSSPALLRIEDTQGKLLHSLALLESSEPEEQGYPAQFAIACETLPDGVLFFSCKSQVLRGSPCSRAQILVGALHDIVDGSLRGWALDAADLQRPLALQLRVDGQTVASFRPNMRRPDISAYLDLPDDSLGLVGFAIPAPEAVADGLPHWIEVVSAANGQALKNGRQRVMLPRSGIPWRALPVPFRRTKPASTTTKSVGNAQPLVSVVILNRNGADVLDALLRSWERHHYGVATEFIVIDHASTDDSLVLLRRWSKRLDLRVVTLDHNDSFSASCNLGARYSRGQYLLFMNNDIVWLQNALPRMLESLQDPQVGIVGIKLLKSVSEGGADSPAASEVQHLGVRFKLNEMGYWPYEATPSLLHNEEEHTPQFVPAVTGAVLLCRKADFEAIGGFDTGYFYGFEDVELCLRLAYRLKKTVLCRNDCVALHRHGHTRLSGREMSVYDRVVRNAHVLESQIGIWIKQAYWRSLVTGDSYITREPLTIGLVLDAVPKIGRNTLLVADMLELARSIDVVLPHARIVLLPPKQDWKNAQNLHVLVVGDLRYDIRTLRRARPDLLTVAWLSASPGIWSKLPWWGAFCAVLAPKAMARRRASALNRPVHASSAERPLGGVLAPSRWRLRVLIDDQAGKPNEANAVAQQLRAEGLPCWILQMFGDTDARPMVDVCITIGKSNLKVTGANRLGGVLYLQWPTAFSGESIGQWLLQEMEASIGSTFHPS